MRIFHSFIGILLLFLLKIRQHPPQIKILFSNLVFLEGSWERTSIHSWWCRWIYSPLISKVFTEYSRVCATKFSFLHHLLFFGVKKSNGGYVTKKGNICGHKRGLCRILVGTTDRPISMEIEKKSWVNIDYYLYNAHVPVSLLNWSRHKICKCAYILLLPWISTSPSFFVFCYMYM